MGDFLGVELLLFDPIILVSVYHFLGKLWWEIGLCTSETPVLALLAEAAMSMYLSFPSCSFWFQLRSMGTGVVGLGASLLVLLDNDNFQSVAVLSLQLLLCKHWTKVREASFGRVGGSNQVLCLCFLPGSEGSAGLILLCILTCYSGCWVQWYFELVPL